MHANRFDRFTMGLANRFTRRQAITRGTMGATAAALALSTRSVSAAQEATPAAADAEKPSYLFIQNFRSGSFAPKADGGDTFTLTLREGMGYTVYYTERPFRSSGAVTTPQFLERMDFGLDNPPNAALVVEVAPGDLDIVIVELTNPSYDEASHTMTYDAVVLSEFEMDYARQFHELPKSDVSHLTGFGAAQLFIDKADFLSCCDHTATCISGDVWYGTSTVHGTIGPVPHCGGCHGIFCSPCYPAQTDKLCNDTFPSCRGQCHTSVDCVTDLGC